MLTLQIPMLLALLGTALMAVVIFAPAPVGPAVTVSFAPPHSPAPVERWSPAPAVRDDPPPFEHWSLPSVEPPEAATSREPGWPALVDAGAAGCDAAARLALVDALAAVRGPWADAILIRARDDETDPSVRGAIASALGA